MDPEVWKARETCIYRGIYGTISILFQGSALVEFDGFDQRTIPLNELTRSPHVAAHRPTRRWDSGDRLPPPKTSPAAQKRGCAWLSGRTGRLQRVKSRE